MSANTDPTKSCAGKVRFATFSAANKTARRPSRRNNGIYRAYKCEHCNGFHLGTTTNRKRRMRPTITTHYLDEA